MTGKSHVVVGRVIPAPTTEFVGEQTPEKVRAQYELVAKHGATLANRRAAQRWLDNAGN